MAEDGTATAVPLPEGAAGQWCLVRVRLTGSAAWWGQVTAEDTARGQVVREAFLGPIGRRRADGSERKLLMHVPAASTGLMLQVFTPGGGEMPGSTRLQVQVLVRVLVRIQAALRLTAGGWRKLPASLRGDRAGLMGRVRVELGQAPARRGEAPPDELWVQLYDGWETARDALAAATRLAPPFDVLICGAAGMADATQAAIAAQSLPPARVRRPGETAAVLPGAWLVVLQAGERLVPHALACFAHAILTQPDARAVVADLQSEAGGILFKPAPDAWLLASGLQTRGACAFHPSVWLADSAGKDADGLRLAMASSVPAASILRIPFVLTHVPDGRPSRRPDGAGPIEAGPQQARARGGQAWPPVSLVVPSACRSAHVIRCLRDVVARTDYPAFEIVLAVSCVDPTDAVQRRVLREAAALPGLRVVDLQQPAFNYAVANNLAVQATSTDLVLLLNDDVSPISRDWLSRMVAFTCGPGAHADIVGARLLYGNDRVQHGGVILGLANLCEHAFRLAARDDYGPYGLALLDRAISAVTAACMLVRRVVWDRLGGLDPAFAIALNDVDFCLRARALQYDIVLAAGVELHHFESLSLGRHYEGDRAGLEAVEVRRLRDHWQAVIADDPFYNPRASLSPGREFRPAFPPRLTPLAWIGGEHDDQH